MSDKKFLFLGDIHGRTIWKDIVKKEKPNLTVFLGDYVSSHTGISERDQCLNLEEILTFKEENQDNVILLRGNHDLESIGYKWARCSPTTGSVVRAYMKSNKERFLFDTQWVYKIQESNILCSHAGVAPYFLNQARLEYNTLFDTTSEDFDITNINKLPPSELFGFTADDPMDSYGISSTQPCTWIRPNTLVMNNIEQFIQIVGHTPMYHISSMATIYHKIWFCDNLEDGEYLTFTDKEGFVVKQIPLH